MKRRPKVSIYLTPAELRKQLKKLDSLTTMIPSQERLMEVRIEGYINYHDWKKIKDGILKFYPSP